MLPLTERITGGIPTSSRRTVERNRTVVARRSPETKRRPTPNFKSLCVGRNSLRTSNRRSMEHATRRTGLWQRCQLLAAPSRLDKTWSLGGSASTAASITWQGGSDRSFPRRDRQPVGPRGFWGDHTGPNPTDRGKKGCKRHVMVDAQGLPLAVEITPANVHDSIPAMRLLDAIPPCAGSHGRPAFRPAILQGDHAYGTPANFNGCAERGVDALMQQLGKRNTEHGSGLGVFRYVVERTLVWFGHHRRLKVCYEKTEAHFQAFHHLAAAVICARRLAAT
jgi:transposase